MACDEDLSGAWSDGLEAWSLCDVFLVIIHPKGRTAQRRTEVMILKLKIQELTSQLPRGFPRRVEVGSIQSPLPYDGKSHL